MKTDNTMTARHSWENGKCIKCGIERKRKHWKKRMAIVNHPPWEGYMHGCDMAYSYDGFKTWVFKSPKCITR